MQIIAVYVTVQCLVVLTLGAPQGGFNRNLQPPTPLQVLDTPSQYNNAPIGYPYANPEYDFQYEITDQLSGNFYGHSETRDGTFAQGSYYVQLPDSRLMKVEYYADEFGYHPTITFEGEAQYPSSPADIYAQQSLVGLAPSQVPLSAGGAIPAPIVSPPSPLFSLPNRPQQVIRQPRPIPGPLASAPQPQLFFPDGRQIFAQPGK